MGIIARVHRNFNRDFTAFDVGETFSGVPYEDGLAAARDFTALVRTAAASAPDGLTAAQATIAWVWQQPGVSTVIPGARAPAQARANAAAGSAKRLGGKFIEGVERICL